jgi:hypothetical protein
MATTVNEDGTTNVMQMPSYLRDLVFQTARVDGDKTRLDEGTWEQDSGTWFSDRTAPQADR